jgi:hypothetical protein
VPSGAPRLLLSKKQESPLALLVVVRGERVWQPARAAAVVDKQLCEAAQLLFVEPCDYSATPAGAVATS